MHALPAIGLALSAIGTGISFYGQHQAAKTQATFAMLNARAQSAQAQMSANVATRNAAISAQQQKNQQLAGEAQAAAYRDDAKQRERAARINISRQQEDQERFRAMLRARGGASGTVADTGSQLDLLEEAARLQVLENAESMYRTGVERRQLARAAEGAQLGAEYAGIQAGLDLMAGEARASGYRAQGVQAQLQGLAGASAARGASMGALGSAFAGFGNLGMQGYELHRLGAFRFSGAS